MQGIVIRSVGDLKVVFSQSHRLGVVLLLHESARICTNQKIVEKRLTIREDLCRFVDSRLYFTIRFHCNSEAWPKLMSTPTR